MFDGRNGQEKMTEGLKNAGRRRAPRSGKRQAVREEGKKGRREVGKEDGTRAKEEGRGGTSGSPDRAKFGHGSVCV